MFVDPSTNLTFLYKLVVFRSTTTPDGKYSSNNEYCYYSNNSDKLSRIANREVERSDSLSSCSGTMFLHDEYVDHPTTIYKFRSKR